MKQADLRKAVPPVPEHFLNAREQTLLRIQQEEIPMKKPVKFSAALAAILIIASLAMGALAAANPFGILDFLSSDGIQPLDGAGDAIQTGLGSASTELYTAAIEEAYFDGSMFAITVHYTAADPKNTALIDMIGAYWGAEHFVTDSDTLETVHRDGKELITALIPDLRVSDVSYDTSIDVVYLPDESLIYMIEGMMHTAFDDALDCTITVGSAPFAPTALHTTQRIDCTLSVTPLARRATLLPENNDEARAIESAVLLLGKLQTQLDVTFTCAPGDGEGDPSGNLVVLKTDGTELHGYGGSSGEITTLPDGAYSCRWILSLPAMEALPERLVFKILAPGSSEWFTPVYCQVSAE